MLDIEQGEALLDYLRATGRIGLEDQPRFHNLAGGVSNRTVLVEHVDGSAWVMKQALEKLRVKVDWFSSPERIHREAAGLRWMQAAVPGYSPALVFEDVEAHLLAMMAVPQPHVNWKTQLLQGVVEPAYVEQFGWLLGRMQRVAVEGNLEPSPASEGGSPFDTSNPNPSPIATGEGSHAEPPPRPALVRLVGEGVSYAEPPPRPSPASEGGSPFDTSNPSPSPIATGEGSHPHPPTPSPLHGRGGGKTNSEVETRQLFADRTFFETLRVEPYYSYSASQVPEVAGFISELIEATRGRTLTLVHGDYSPKNVLIYEGRIVLLDYEVIHWGDPAFDVGFALTHLLSKAHALPEHRAAFAAAARTFWARYWGQVQALEFAVGLEGYAVHHTLACLLARAAGRSPLEYLDAGQRAHQQAVVVRLMGDVPATVDELVERFTERI